MGRDTRMIHKGRKQDGVRRVQPMADKFQVHGGFVHGPDGLLLRVDTEKPVIACPIHQWLKVPV